MRRLLVLAVLLCGVACSSSSAPAIVATPNANIAGTYPTAVVTNAGTATFTGCTGDLLVAQGLTLLDTGDPTCVSPDPLVVTQTGSAWRSGNQFVICATITYVVSASGTINGDRIDGSVFIDYNTGVRETQTITNGVVGTGGTVVLRISRVSLSGGLSGSCSIVPPVEEVFSQTRSSESGSVSGGGMFSGWK